MKIKLNKDFVISELSLSPETWEKLKKEGDKQLYKKLNKYADYEELRIHLGEKYLELEAHCVKEEPDKLKSIVKEKVEKIKDERKAKIT